MRVHAYGPPWRLDSSPGDDESAISSSAPKRPAFTRHRRPRPKWWPSWNRRSWAKSAPAPANGAGSRRPASAAGLSAPACGASISPSQSTSGPGGRHVEKGHRGPRSQSYLRALRSYVGHRRGNDDAAACRGRRCSVVDFPLERDRSLRGRDRRHHRAGKACRDPAQPDPDAAAGPRTGDPRTAETPGRQPAARAGTGSTRPNGAGAGRPEHRRGSHPGCGNAQSTQAGDAGRGSNPARPSETGTASGAATGARWLPPPPPPPPSLEHALPPVEAPPPPLTSREIPSRHRRRSRHRPRRNRNPNRHPPSGRSRRRGQRHHRSSSSLRRSPACRSRRHRPHNRHHVRRPRFKIRRTCMA